MAYTERNPYVARIEALEEELETLRARAEAAESALRGNQWDVAVFPLSLQMTRIMRLLVRRDLSFEQISAALSSDYGSVTTNVIKAQICRIRPRLPAHIVPPRNASIAGGVAVYTIPDRPALAEFLRSGVLPEQRRAA
jgi:hypothetical protein